jgi:glycosyltransferase involved in cell wall biosynthesis
MWGARLGRKSLQFTGCSQFIANMGACSAGTWEAIPNFVELNKFDFQPTVASDAQLVFLSRVERIKGAHTAIRIAKKTGRRLLIAGNHGDTGEDARYWQTEILPHLGKDGIEYVGPVDDIQKNRLLGQAVAMIVPIEWNEPFGIVFAEALACGTPVISCPRGALPEIIRPGIEGFLIDSEEEGCQAVERLAELSRAACRQRAEEHFSSSIVAEQYLGLYQELMNDDGK